MADGAIRRKIVLNGRQFENENEMPRQQRKLYEDVMSVIENNGEVTLPGNGNAEPLLTRGQILFIVLLALGIGSLVLVRLLS